MNDLEETRGLLSGDADSVAPLELLAKVLGACIELVSLEENDFAWSSWESRHEAVAELTRLRDIAENGTTPELHTISALFAPTGPLQEISLSSGWGRTFLEVAKKYDLAESRIWPELG